MDFTLVDKCISVVSKRNSGKTCLVKYLVQKHREDFGKVFLISSTESINNDFSSIIEPNCLFTEWSEQWASQLMDKMSERTKKDKQEHNEPYRVLLILDDICSNINLNKCVQFKRIYTTGRHYRISIIVIQQYLYQIPRICRSNLDYLLCSQSNNSSLEILLDEFLMGDVSRKEFVELYHKSTCDYYFLIINCTTVKDNTDKSLIYGKLKCPAEYI